MKHLDLSLKAISSYSYLISCFIMEFLSYFILFVKLEIRTIDFLAILADLHFYLVNSTLFEELFVNLIVEAVSKLLYFDWTNKV